MTKQDFYDDIPLMINRACRLRGISQAALAAQMGYSSRRLQDFAKGKNIESMPVGALIALLDLAECEYEWKRK